MSVTTKGFDRIIVDLKKSIADEIEYISDTYQSEVKQRTPILTGQARRGWRERTRGNDREVRNQVPYIERLEGGYSRQAPRGFVKQSVTATLNKRKTRR